jgi:CheY-like chemotaxis protein
VHTLLLADESAAIQRVVELIFADQDVDIVAVGDGHEAIRRVDAAPPDIVLADIGMPGRDGYEVARHVKDNSRLAHIPVVLLAGAFDSVDQDRARAAGCAGILTKPLERQLVISRVQELLAAPRSAPPALDARLAARPDVPPDPEARAADEENTADHLTARAQQLDSYFDTLDAAFADRLQAPAGSQPATMPTADLPDAGPAGISDTPAGSTLANTFAALLAEQVEPPRADIPAAAHGATDEIVDQVSRRVLTQLTDRVVRETVRELVSAIAERLVREEIERIKAAVE